MTALTTAFVAEAMRSRGYEVREGPEQAITAGAADSRAVRPGNLFTAFPGENTDGNRFVAAALEAGAAAAICERAPAGYGGAATIVVAPDATRAVGELARAWRRACGARVVGITGTVGKTTAKEVTAHVLSTRFRTHRSAGNFNSREGLPLALLSLDSEDEVSVLEMGMDSAGEIARLCEIAEPAAGAVLNIGLTHVEKLGSIEAIAHEKLTLPRSLPSEGTAILNMDDARVAEVATELRCKVIGFGESPAARLRRGPIEDLGLNGTRCVLSYEGLRAELVSPLPGAHVVPAALTAVAAGIALGMTIEDAAGAVRSLPATGRLEARTSSRGATVLDDRYNASPASVAGALRLLANLPGKRIALLGKMAELGAHAEEEHQRIGRVAAESCTTLAAFGDLGRVVVDAARNAGLDDARWFETKEAAAESVAASSGSGDTILVKGSRSEALETILPLLGVAP